MRGPHPGGRTIDPTNDGHPVLCKGCLPILEFRFIYFDFRPPIFSKWFCLSLFAPYAFFSFVLLGRVFLGGPRIWPKKGGPLCPQRRRSKSRSGSSQWTTSSTTFRCRSPRRSRVRCPGLRGSGSGSVDSHSIRRRDGLFPRSIPSYVRKARDRK